MIELSIAFLGLFILIAFVGAGEWIVNNLDLSGEGE